jgi:hypothetical protein
MRLWTTLSAHFCSFATDATERPKRLRRLPSGRELGLPRCLPKATPSPVREILREASGQLNLVEAYLGTDREPELLSVFSTDFTGWRTPAGSARRI